MAGAFPVVVLLLVSGPFAGGIGAQETKTGNPPSTQSPSQRPAQDKTETNSRGKPAQVISTPQKEPSILLNGWLAEVLYGDRAADRMH